MYIAIAIFIFGLIIAIHEFGHYIAAKLFGVGVPEFAIGMGPRLLKKQGKETLYSLRAIPIGGFCSMDGDDNEVQGPKSLFSKPIWQRIIIFVAGSFLNIVAGFLVILFVVVPLMLSTVGALSTTTLSGLHEDFPLTGEHGLMAGDRFHRIDGVRIYQNNNIGMFLDMRTHDTVDIVVIRDGRQVELNDLPLQRQNYLVQRPVLDEAGTPLYIDGEPVYEEVSAYLFGFFFHSIQNPTVFDRVTYAWNDTRDFMRQLPLTIRMFATGQAGMEDVSSVVGIVDIMHQAGTTAPTAGMAVLRLAMLAAIISISVAMVNLAPIPGLDGGRIFLMLVTAAIEKITRRPVNRKIETYINAVGLALLFAFMIYIVLADIIQIASR